MRFALKVISSSALALGATAGASAVTVDLATESAGYSIWGDVGNAALGDDIALGDINDDGYLDLAVSQRGEEPDPGRGVCVFLGPLDLPGFTDLLGRSCPILVGAGAVPQRLQIADVDNDGIVDVLVGTNGRNTRGQVSIFRGRTAWPSRLALSAADWTFLGRDDADQMFQARAGDLNGDGFADVVLNATSASGPANLRGYAGEVYVVFGGATGPPRNLYDFATEDPDVIVYGADGDLDPPSGAIGDHLGDDERLAVADILGDSIPDLILGAYDGCGSTNSALFAGEVVVLRGRASWPPVIDLRNPANASLVVYGPRPWAHLATPLVADWNHDGEPDLVLGSSRYEQAGGGRAVSGAIFILYGRSRFTGSWDLAGTPADETILGARVDALLGYRLAVGDVNADGHVDIVSNDNSRQPNGGGVAVISGCGGQRSYRDLLTLPAEMSIIGAYAGDGFGNSLAAADVDGDGRADVFGGAPGSLSLDHARPKNAGEARLVLGRAFGQSCSILAAVALPPTACGVEDIVLDASQTVVVGCSGSAQYRWSRGATVLRDWASDPTAIVSVSQAGNYRVDVRCGSGDCLAHCTGSATVAVAIDPDVAPPDLGNSLRAARRVTDVALRWAAEPLARSYAVLGTELKGDWSLPPIHSQLPAPEDLLIDISAPPPLLYLRAVGASCSGQLGP